MTAQTRFDFCSTSCTPSRNVVPKMFALTVCLLMSANVHAIGTVQIIIDGEINVFDTPGDDSVTAAELGLQDGDPIQFVFEFDRVLPATDAAGVSAPAIERFDAFLDGQAFASLFPLEEVEQQALVSINGDSGFGLSVSSLI